MSKIVRTIADFPPTVDFYVYISTQLYRHFPPSYRAPKPVQVRGLIDTGAEISAVDCRIIEQLNIAVKDVIPILTGAGDVEAPVFDVAFVFPNDFVKDLRVIGISLRDQPYQALIGTDVLKGAKFCYDGINDCFSLEFKNNDP